VARHTVAGEVVGTGARDLLQEGDLPGNHRTVAQLADAEDAVDPVTNQINEAIPLADVELDLGIAPQKIRKGRDDEVARQSAVHVDPQEPFGLALLKAASASSKSAMRRKQRW